MRILCVAKALRNAGAAVEAVIHMGQELRVYQIVGVKHAERVVAPAAL